MSALKEQVLKMLEQISQKELKKNSSITQNILKIKKLLIWTTETNLIEPKSKQTSESRKNGKYDN